MNIKQHTKDLLYALKKKQISNSSAFLLCYLKHFWNPKNKLERILDNLFKSKPGAFILQVGANDGFVNDPLYKFIKKYKASCILSEPQKKPFSVPKSIYHKDDIEVINCAIDRVNGTRKLYRLSFSDERWASGLSSFNHDQMVKVINSGMIEQKAKKYKIKLPADKNYWISFDEVESLNFETLEKNLHIKAVDLLMIDTEGFDAEIIKMFDFAKFRPLAVVFEKTHLSDEDYLYCKELLKSFTYDLIEENANCIGIYNHKEWIN